MALFHGNAIPSAAEDYLIAKSCRFNDDDSAYLSRTPGATGNRRTWTMSFWVKRNNLATSFDGLVSSAGTANATQIGFLAANNFIWYEGGATHTTTAVYRDVANWYHIVCRFDSTDGVSGDRMRIYINGSEVTSFGTETSVSLNHDSGINNTEVFQIGRATNTDGSSHWYADCYISEFNFIDGTALTPSSFGKTGKYGEWIPKEYTGSHGTQGFYLDFADASDLGDDESGNGNDFAETNIVAGDQVLDTPTNNFCTLNNLDDALLHKGTFAEGNLKYTGASTGNPWGGGYNYQGGQVGTIYTSNKFYYEWYVGANASQWMAWGIAPDDYSPSQIADRDINDTLPGRTHGIVNHGVSTDINYNLNYYDGSTTLAANQSNLSATDIVMMAFDPATGKYWWGRNGTWEDSGNPATGANPIVTLSNLSRDGVAHTWTAFIAMLDATHWCVMNFGQDGTFGPGNVTAGGNADGNGYGNFKYAVPSGFLSLCSANLDTPSVTPSKHFNTILFDDGAGAKTGVGFQPDLVWVKSRGSTYEHELTDSVRGVTKALSSDSVNIESTDSTGLTAFGADGFTVGADTNYADTTGDGMVAWCWKANGSGSSNEDGSINTTSTSANVSAGFSISTYTGTGSNATVGHGLSKAPELVITKSRSNGEEWRVGSIQALGSLDFTDYMQLDDASALTDLNTTWNDTAPTSSVVSVGTEAATNNSGYTYVNYCFHSVEGYSKVGSFLGNGSADGPFIFCNFRPAWIMWKRLSSTNQWVIHDSMRNISNQIDQTIYGNLTDADSTADVIYTDFLSNGVKLRSGTAGNSNTAASTYLYIVFAEQPFKHSNAR